MCDADNKVQAGQIVTANQNLIDPATGDHPEFIMASKGDKIEIVEYTGGIYDYSAINKAYSPNAFRLNRTEFDV